MKKACIKMIRLYQKYIHPGNVMVTANIIQPVPIMRLKHIRNMVFSKEQP